jgi:beta-lactamase class A
MFVFICAGLVAGFAWWLIPTSDNATPSGADNFPLLAKRISIDEPNDTIINFSDLRTTLNTFYADQKLDGGIYFEYLPTGTSIRVNANEEFRPASLLKLPVAMEFYRGVELGKIDPKQTVALKDEWLNSEYGELYKKGAGYELVLEDAVRIMLTESDNTALRVLTAATENLDIKDRALGALDIEFSRDENSEISVGARSYASFLKCLYFACFNSKAHSQTILDYLTQTPFDDRLKSGLPKEDNVKFAHKVGVFNTQVQSDCGLVYLEKRNYILCVMVRGANNDAIKNYFKQLSATVYDYVKMYPL